MTKTTSRTVAAATALTLAKKHLTESIVTELAYERNAQEFYDAIEVSHPTALEIEEVDNLLDFNEGYATFNVTVKGGDTLVVTFCDGAYETIYKA